MKYGKFENFDAFLNSYIMEENKKKVFEINDEPRAIQPELIKKFKDRDVVEVMSVSKEHQPNEPGVGGEIDYHIIINVTQIQLSDPDVEDDINRCIRDKAPVFVAVRYGDGMGISVPIEGGLEQGSTLHIKGVWITEDKALSHGGEKMSVLHFTHHPVGFICTPEKCYE